MPPHESLVAGLHIVSFAIGCGAAVHLTWNGLYKRYRILFFFLCLQVARSVALFVASQTAHPRNAYSWTWVCTEPLISLSYILVVSELYTLVLQNYKGLQTVGRWIL